ncbi:MAG TPA: four helix bundle protein [Pyrinomonadaceae bacterium]|jgi:four helix bundle protein|nr:four helix bundle protein [Pyrinomonadaceae bacterium]
MAKSERFEDLDVWQLAKEVANLTYDITLTGKFSHDYVLRDQVRRASVSIFSNIAEGFERDGNKEFIQFLSISKGSCGELRAQLRFALDRKYITQEEFDLMLSKLISLSVQISKFRTYLRQNDLKGRKFI